MRIEKEFLKVHSDDRGQLFEVINVTGTQFVSITKPGVTRGHHYHLNKTEWFTVLRGEGYLFTRDLDTGVEVLYHLTGEYPQVIGIDARVVHAIRNVGTDELILLVQSSEVFDPLNPDTYEENV